MQRLKTPKHKEREPSCLHNQTFQNYRHPAETLRSLRLWHCKVNHVQISFIGTPRQSGILSNPASLEHLSPALNLFCQEENGLSCLTSWLGVKRSSQTETSDRWHVRKYTSPPRRKCSQVESHKPRRPTHLLYIRFIARRFFCPRNCELFRRVAVYIVRCYNGI